MAKSIGEVNERAYYEGGLNDPGLGPNFRAGAKAVLLYALDLMSAAGVTPAEASAQLRAGKTIEEVCTRRALNEEQRQKNAEFLAIFNGPDMAEGGDNGR